MEQSTQAAVHPNGPDTECPQCGRDWKNDGIIQTGYVYYRQRFVPESLNTLAAGWGATHESWEDCKDQLYQCDCGHEVPDDVARFLMGDDYQEIDHA